MSDLTNMIAESPDSIYFAKKIILAISKNTDIKVDELWKMICNKTEKEVRKVFKTKRVRSTNSYAFFVKDEETQKEVSDKLNEETELTHKQKFAKKAMLISEMWSNKKDKSKWITLAGESKKNADLQNGCKNKPKRKTCYQLFSDSIRYKVQEDNPTLEFGQITKICSEKWMELKKNDPEKIEYWKEEADKYNEIEKEKHNNLLVTKAIQDEEKLEKLEEEKEKLETETDTNTKNKKKKNTPFDKFKKKNKKEILKKYPEIAGETNQVTQKLNELWKSLTDEEKEKYN
jgi:hypothetical protein